jgi:hypothetical protein
VLDTLIAIFAFIQIIFVYYANDNYVIYKNDIDIDYFNWIICVTVFIIDLLIFVRYRVRFNILKLTYKVGKHTKIFSTRYGFYLILELLVSSICMPPGYDGTFSGSMLNGRYEYSYSSLVYVVCMLRTSYLVTRIYFHYSIWRSISSKKIAAAFNIPIDADFELKAELTYHPMTIAWILLLLTVINFGFAIRNFEVGFTPDDGTDFKFQHMFNAMWLTIVSMTTVGYGDIYPQTYPGRAFAVLSFLFGNFLISFTSSLNPSKNTILNLI